MNSLIGCFTSILKRNINNSDSFLNYGNEDVKMAKNIGFGFVRITNIELCFLLVTVFICGQGFSQTTPEGTAWVSSHGYSGCVELSNKTTRIVLEPNCGGRILEYSLNGQNALYVNPKQDGWTYTPGIRGIDPSGGRCDIGPELTIQSHPVLWLGTWTAEITGPRTARLTSSEDDNTGVQLIRDFMLDRDSSYLRFVQTIKNVSSETKQYNHWSRTFADGGGICLVPLTSGSRFPQGYIICGPRTMLNYRDEPQPNLRTRGGYLEIIGPPTERQIGCDSYAGWLGYITRSNLLFVKKFPVYPERVYGEIAAYTVVIWYNQLQMCELEPIGPRETLKPGESASFIEDWWLFPYTYPGEGKEVDLVAFEKFVKDNARKVITPGTKVEKLAGDYTWAEGPVEDNEGNVYFTDNRENLIHKWSQNGETSIFLKDARRTNGLHLDKDGRIIACTGNPPQLVSIDKQGNMTVLADSYEGKPLNAPNDLWIDPKGGIYFTDPYWGREEGHSRVYYLSPDRKKLTPVIYDMGKPNGIVGTPDCKRLYVTDWVDKMTFVYTINPDGTVGDKKLFAPEGDDGLTIDSEGNVYLTGNAVTVYQPDGFKIDTIEVPETPANLIFYGRDKQQLFITARTSVYSVRLKTRGL